METVENVFWVLGALLVGAGTGAIVWLEFSSSGERRLTSRARDAFEVLLPAVLVIVLVWLVAIVGEASPV